MNYIKQLTGFFDRVVLDQNLNPTHVSLYIALFQYWNINRFQNPISITRDEIMKISKICSKSTYHKCMRDLHDKGYVIYNPSYNPFRGSLVQMLDLVLELKIIKKTQKGSPNNELVIGQALDKLWTGSGQVLGQALVSSINIKNNANNANILNFGKNEKTPKNNLSKIATAKNLEFTQKKLREKKGTEIQNTIPPEWKNVLDFFIEKNATETDAQKFFNHFESNGWLVGGKSKMKDWKAASRNWLLNAVKFQQNQPQPNHLHTQNLKNYAEPL